MASRRGGRRKISKAPTLLLGAFFVFRILDTRVQHVLHSESEGLCNDLQFLQGEVTLIQLPFRYPTADDVADKLLDFLRRRFLQAARGAFDRIRQADDSALLKLG